MKRFACLLLVLSLPWSAALAAGDHDLDHDRARRAVEEGRILPLRDILARAQAAFPGRMVETELENEDGVPVYEIKILAEDGRVMKLHYDARTGDLLRSKVREGRR